MMKVLVVFGTRPEAVEMCPLVREFRALGEMEVGVCVTGQNREMLGQVFEQFQVAPDFDLQIAQEEQDRHDFTQSVQRGMKKVLEEYAPNLVLVHDDTATAFAAAQACHERRTSIAYVKFE